MKMAAWMSSTLCSRGQTEGNCTPNRSPRVSHSTSTPLQMFSILPTVSFPLSKILNSLCAQQSATHPQHPSTNPGFRHGAVTLYSSFQSAPKMSNSRAEHRPRRQAARGRHPHQEGLSMRPRTLPPALTQSTGLRESTQLRMGRQQQVQQENLLAAVESNSPPIWSSTSHSRAHLRRQRLAAPEGFSCACPMTLPYSSNSTSVREMVQKLASSQQGRHSTHSTRCSMCRYFAPRRACPRDYSIIQSLCPHGALLYLLRLLWGYHPLANLLFLLAQSTRLTRFWLWPRVPRTGLLGLLLLLSVLDLATAITDRLARCKRLDGQSAPTPLPLLVNSQTKL